MDTFLSHASLLTDEAIELAQQMLGDRYQAYTRAAPIPPQDAIGAIDCPCLGCQAACDCEATGHCCKAYKRYLTHGKWHESDRGVFK